MPIVEADIQKRYSVSAAAGDTTPGTASGNLGDQVSQTQIPDDQLNNIFSDVTGDQAAAGVVQYRPVFILNNHATLTLVGAIAQITSQTADGSTVAIAVDNIPASAKGSSSAQAATIASETTAPGGVGAFGSSATLGDLGPGQTRALWVRRTTPPGAVSPSPDGVDGFTLEITGDTLP